MWLHLGSFNPYAFGLGVVCIGGLFLWPHVFKPGRLLKRLSFENRLDGRLLRLTARLPGPIVALVSLSALAAAFDLPVKTIGSRFGGIPATGTIARTVTNVRAGATSPVTGIVHALLILLMVLLAAPLASSVPLAMLAGILLFVAWNMGEWHEFARLRHFSTQYRVILVGTFALTVVFDLTLAVEVGLVLACVFFIYRMSTLCKVLPHASRPGEVLPEGVQVVELYGSLFFGAVGGIETLPLQVLPGTRTLVLKMNRLVLIGASGIDALQQLHRSLQRRGVTPVLASVNEQPLSLIRRSGLEAIIGARHTVPGLEDLDAATR